MEKEDMTEMRKENQRQYHARMIYKALVQLNDVNYEARKAGIELGAVLEVDTKGLIDEVRRVGKINWGDKEDTKTYGEINKIGSEFITVEMKDSVKQ